MHEPSLATTPGGSPALYFHLAQVGSWSWDIDSDTVTWSDELFRISGLDPAGGAPCFEAQRDLYAGDGWERLKRACEWTIESGEPHELELEVVRPEGSSRWIFTRAAARRDDSGRVVALYGTAQDITESRRAYDLLARNEALLRAANERLERSERRYRELVESLNEIVWATDLDGRVTYVSPNAAEYGYRAADLVGQPFARIVHAEDLAAVNDAIELALGGSPARCEYRAYDAHGTVRHVRTSFRAHFEAGRPTGLSGVLMDITEQRKAEEQLRASQRLEAVGRLAGGVAHDFNNLLVVIKGYAELGMRRLPDGDPLRGDLEEILRAGERAASLTQQLLAFGRKQLLRPSAVNLNDIVVRMSGMLTRVIGEDIAFTTDLAPDLPAVFIDPPQMEHAILNLVVNARDAMPEGGRLTIRTELTQPTCLDLPDTLEGRPLVVLTVEDDGCGMDEATRARVFEPFFTTKPAGQGNGLGLPMVYGFVTQSGGAIGVASERDAGCRVSIAFAPYGPAAAGTLRNTGAVLRGSERILVVEDDDAVRHLVGRVLTSAGYRWTAAASPSAAVDLLTRRSCEFDLLLTDFVMPEMSGAELAERATSLCPSLRVLFMTGYRELPGGGTQPAHPSAPTLMKPFTSAQLTAAIRATLSSDAPRA